MRCPIGPSRVRAGIVSTSAQRLHLSGNRYRTSGLGPVHIPDSPSIRDFSLVASIHSSFIAGMSTQSRRRRSWTRCRIRRYFIAE